MPINYIQTAPGEWVHPSRLNKDHPKFDPTPPGSYEGPKPPKKRIRQSTKPLLNKLEQEFFDLECKRNHPYTTLAQSIRFKLGNGIWYKPDIFVPMTMTCYEVKGPHAFRGGFENLKVAAHQYPDFQWILVWKEDGQWRQQEVLP